MTTINNPIRTYSELMTLPTFEQRYQYLRLSGRVGADTFGFDRYLNQRLYQRDPRWKDVREHVIIRDNGCDLGIEDRMIFDKVLVHHMNPVTIDDILKEREWIFDPEFLICTSHITHNAIHYGDENLLMKAPIERRPNDTCPWKQGL